MTDACQKWVARCLALHPIRGDVLEVGSLDVNGTPRYHFADVQRFPSYVGIDMRDGPGVDRIMLANALEFPDAAFGVLVTTEMLEHDRRFWESSREFSRVLKPGGHLIITTRGFHFDRHDFPSDYWRFSKEALVEIMLSAGLKPLDSIEDEVDQGAFAIGVKA